MNKPLSLTEQSVCQKVRMNPDESGKVHNNLLVLAEASGTEMGKEITLEKLSVAPTRKVMGKRLGTKMKMTGSCSSISRCLRPLLFLIQWHPQLPPVHWCPSWLLPPQESWRLAHYKHYSLDCQRKRNAQHQSQELCFIWWQNWGLKWDTASQVTLRGQLQRDKAWWEREWGRIYKSFCNQGQVVGTLKDYC